MKEQDKKKLGLNQAVINNANPPKIPETPEDTGGSGYNIAAGIGQIAGGTLAKIVTGGIERNILNALYNIFRLPGEKKRNINAPVGFFGVSEKTMNQYDDTVQAGIDKLLGKPVGPTGKIQPTTVASDAYRPPKTPEANEEVSNPSKIALEFGTQWKTAQRPEEESKKQLTEEDRMKMLGLTKGRIISQRGNEKLFEKLGIPESEAILTNRENKNLFEENTKLPPGAEVPEFLKTDKAVNESVRNALQKNAWPFGAISDIYGRQNALTQAATAMRGQDLNYDSEMNKVKMLIQNGENEKAIHFLSTLAQLAPETTRTSEDGLTQVKTKDYMPLLNSLDKQIGLKNIAGINIKPEQLNDVYTALDDARTKRLAILGEKPKPEEEKLFYDTLIQRMMNAMGRDKLTEEWLKKDPYMNQFKDEQEKLLASYRKFYAPKEK